MSQTNYKREGGEDRRGARWGTAFGSDVYGTCRNHGAPASTFVFTPGYGHA